MKYLEEHYEDVAGLLAGVHVDHGQSKYAWDRGQGGTAVVKQLVADFADLFATDNPKRCRHCNMAPTFKMTPCVAGSHDYGLGFNRGQFLKACGLES